MKKVFKLASLPVNKSNSFNDITTDDANHIQNSRCRVLTTKSNISERCQDNSSQYGFITVPVHKIKILNLKKMTPISKAQTILTAPIEPRPSSNVTYSLPSFSNLPSTTGKQVVKIASKSVGSSKIFPINMERISGEVYSQVTTMGKQVLSLPSKGLVGSPQVCEMNNMGKQVLSLPSKCLVGSPQVCEMNNIVKYTRKEDYNQVVTTNKQTLTETSKTELSSPKVYGNDTTKISRNKISNQENDGDHQLISPSCRWLSQPKIYRGATKDYSQRKIGRKSPVSAFVDTTDGETSGMGSSVDEPVESSTESASEASTSFLQPRLSSRPLSTSPSAIKKRRGGWPKGRKRKPEPPGTKPPKAPLTAYVLFLNERRKFYKETHPQLPFVEVTKLLGAEWSSMTQIQKAVYMTRSEQDKKRYRNELQTYRQSHDYQILLRKKRIKSAINRGQTTEESSDFTDEVDDDDSEELHCRTCDQWFSSLHNKREHLYGKTHLQAITGEYQREREAEEKRQMSTPPIVINLLSSKLEEEEEKKEKEEKIKEKKKTKPELNIQHNKTPSDTLKFDGSASRRDSIGITSTTEDDEDDGDVDDEEDSEYDGEGEVTEEEGGTEVLNDTCLSCSSSSARVTDAAEGIVQKVMDREVEIKFLRSQCKENRENHQQMLRVLENLHEKFELLQEQKEGVFQEGNTLVKEVEDMVLKIKEMCRAGTRPYNPVESSDTNDNNLDKCSIGTPKDESLIYSKFIDNTSKGLLSTVFTDSSTSLDKASFDNYKMNDFLLLSERKELNNPVDSFQLGCNFDDYRETDKTSEMPKVASNISDTSIINCKNELQPVFECENIISDSINSLLESNDLGTSTVKLSVNKRSFNESKRSSFGLGSSSTSSESRKPEREHSYSKLTDFSAAHSFEGKKGPNRRKPSPTKMGAVNGHYHTDPPGRAKLKLPQKDSSTNTKNCTNEIEETKLFSSPTSSTKAKLKLLQKDSNTNTETCSKETEPTKLFPFPFSPSPSSSAVVFSSSPFMYGQTNLKEEVESTIMAKSSSSYTNQTYFSQDILHTAPKQSANRNTPMNIEFHSIKEEPPNGKILTQKRLEDDNLIKDTNNFITEPQNKDSFFLSSDIIPAEEPPDLEYYINSLIQGEENYPNSETKLFTISEADLQWEQVSRAPNFRHHNLSSLPSLDKIFEEDDSFGNLLSETG